MAIRIGHDAGFLKWMVRKTHFRIMSARMTHSLPDRVDLPKLAAQAATLSGEVPASELTRVGRLFRDVQAVQVSLSFAQDEQGRATIRGHLQTAMTARCQRCLQPVAFTVAGEIDFGHDEMHEADAAPRRGADAAFDLKTFIEDEVLLASPMITLHPLGTCEYPAPEESPGPAAPPNPFDVLRTFRQNDPNDRT